VYFLTDYAKRSIALASHEYVHSVIVVCVFFGWVTKNLSSQEFVSEDRIYFKPLVLAAFAVVSTPQPALGLHGGVGPFSLCVIHKGRPVPQK
jgi:hypothetical protein